MRAAAPGAAGAAAPPPDDAAPDGADSLTAAKDPKYDRRWAASRVVQYRHPDVFRHT